MRSLLITAILLFLSLNVISQRSIQLSEGLNINTLWSFSDQPGFGTQVNRNIGHQLGFSYIYTRTKKRKWKWRKEKEKTRQVYLCLINHRMNILDNSNNGNTKTHYLTNTDFLIFGWNQIRDSKIFHPMEFYLGIEIMFTLKDRSLARRSFPSPSGIPNSFRSSFIDGQVAFPGVYVLKFGWGYAYELDDNFSIVPQVNFRCFTKSRPAWSLYWVISLNVGVRYTWQKKKM